MFKRALKLILSASLGSLLIAVQPVSAADAKFQVTITNITSSIVFTPILVASHRQGASIFDLGSAASLGLEELAEGGSTTTLAGELAENSAVVDIQNSGGVLAPGEWVTVIVDAKHGAKYVSLASMMLPTNDGFIGLNSVRVPKKGSAIYFSPGYDAGTETNDELCISIPGPPPVCGGEGFSSAGGEGYVHINRGIHGIGDLATASYDWRNPVAQINVRRVRGDD